MVLALFHDRCFLPFTVASALLLAGCSPAPIAGQKSGAKKAVAVKAVAVATEDVPQTTVQPATVLALNEAEIRARTSGYVSELAVDIGDYVSKGDTLAVISVPEMQKQIQVLEARIGRYEAEELRAQAGIKLAEAGIESAEARLQQAKSSMSGAEASLAAAEAEFGRTSDLVDRQSLQRRMLDEVRKKRDTEVANQSSAESSIVSAEADVIVAQAELASAEANMAAAKSETEVAHKQLEELKVFMDYATLKAPFAGIVTSRSIDLGDLVQQDSQDKSLFVVSQIDKVRVQMPVPEAAAALVNPGDAVTLTLPSFSGETAIKTTVTRVSGSLDPSSRTMLVESELENKDNKLIPGMFGQASITLATNVAANMLPARAIRFAESGQAYVYALGDDETVSVIDITTGIDDGSKIEVLSGVSEGQRVIDAHLKRFKDGQKVALLD